MMPGDLRPADDEPSADDVDEILPPPPGRIDRWRKRADEAGDRYQAKAVDQPALGLPLALLARYTARQGMLLASACAFRLFLWMLPLALIASGVLAALSRGGSTDVETAARQSGLTGAASQQIVGTIKSGQKSWWVAVIIGSVLLIWTTRTLMRNLTMANGHIWGVPIRKAKQKELTLTTIVFALAWLLIFVAVAAIGKAGQYIPGGVIVVGALQAVVLGFAWLALSMRLPDRRTSWTDLIPGAVLFGVAFAILHAVSRIYLPSKIRKSSELYGSLGIAATMLAWLLIIGELIVLTALVNVVWSDYRAQLRERNRTLVADDLVADEPVARTPPSTQVERI